MKRRQNDMKLSVRIILGWAYFSGAVTIIIGLLHNAMIFTLLPGMQPLPQESYFNIWFFLCLGTAVAFAGLLCIYAVRGLRRGEPWARFLMLASSLFLGLMGTGGTVLIKPFSDGPLILAGLAVMCLLPWLLMPRVGRMVPSSGTA
jgi:hypothetical protein